jgi:hypothetical protein
MILCFSSMPRQLSVQKITWATSTALGRTIGYHAQSDPDLSERAGRPRAGDERLRGIGVLYATGGGHGPGVSLLAAAGLGGAAAPGAAQMMGWLFPYSLVCSERRLRLGLRFVYKARANEGVRRWIR